MSRMLKLVAALCVLLLAAAPAVSAQPAQQPATPAALAPAWLPVLPGYPPIPRSGHSAIWTGSPAERGTHAGPLGVPAGGSGEMIIWGGLYSDLWGLDDCYFRAWGD